MDPKQLDQLKLYIKETIAQLHEHQPEDKPANWHGVLGNIEFGFTTIIDLAKKPSTPEIQKQIRETINQMMPTIEYLQTKNFTPKEEMSLLIDSLKAITAPAPQPSRTNDAAFGRSMQNLNQELGKLFEMEKIANQIIQRKQASQNPNSTVDSQLKILQVLQQQYIKVLEQYASMRPKLRELSPGVKDHHKLSLENMSQTLKAFSERANAKVAEVNKLNENKVTGPSSKNSRG